MILLVDGDLDVLEAALALVDPCLVLVRTAFDVSLSNYKRLLRFSQKFLR